MSLSGGMRQRVMIAMALVCEPRLLIADEPTTALDVTIQAQIMDLLLELSQRTGTAILFITHNLGLVAESCSRMLTMYAGQVVEDGPVDEILSRPFHPYTAGLLGSMPQAAPAQDEAAVDPRPRPLAARRCRRAAGSRPRCAYVEPPCREPQELRRRAAPATCAAGEPTRWRCREPGRVSDILTVDDLGIDFPGRASVTRSASAVDGVGFEVSAGRDLRRDRRIRLGQIDARPLHRLPAAADAGTRPALTARIRLRSAPASCAAIAARSRSSSRTRTPRSIRA